MQLNEIAEQIEDRSDTGSPYAKSFASSSLASMASERGMKELASERMSKINSQQEFNSPLKQNISTKLDD